ncbi:MAG: glycosyltransferase family 2 protein [Verrucomicrobiota bacterium]
MSDRQSLVSIVTPAFNEAENIPILYERLVAVLDDADVAWEWIVVDDHSTDETQEVLGALACKDERVRSPRFSRNFGSHIGILCGLRHSKGDCAIVMAADLQDPPDVIPRLLERWESGIKTVWAVREKREGESLLTLAFARLYYLLVRAFTELDSTPKSGADLWLVDRVVIDTVNADPERHSSVPSLVRWMGFSQDSIYYTKAPRKFGRSKWTLSRKINHAINTFVATTAVPIRYMTYVGFITTILGFLYSFFIIVHSILGSPVQGWSSLMVVFLLVSGIQMTMLGVLGEYLWRTYEESRQRPRYIVESFLNLSPEEEDGSPLGNRFRDGVESKERQYR